MDKTSWGRAARAFAWMLALMPIAGQAAVVSAELAAFTGTTTVSFEEVAAGTSVTTEYASAGVANFNAEVRGARGHAQAHMPSMFLLPGAVSGDRVGFIGATVEFAAGVDRVGVWLYKGNGQQFLSVLDASQNVLFSVSLDRSSRDSEWFDFVGIVSSTRDIRYAVIANKDLAASATWDVSGPTTFYDDLMFTPITAVPEPGTCALMGLGLAALGVLRKAARPPRRPG